MVLAASNIKQSASSQITIDRFFKYLTRSHIGNSWHKIKDYAPVAEELAEPIK
jgi:hypothetical protein